VFTTSTRSVVAIPSFSSWETKTVDCALNLGEEVRSFLVQTFVPFETEKAIHGAGDSVLYSCDCVFSFEKDIIALSQRAGESFNGVNNGGGWVYCWEE